MSEEEDNNNNNNDNSSKRILTNFEISMLIDGLDELRKSDSTNIHEISQIGNLAEKLGAWLSEARFGIDIFSNVRESSTTDNNQIGISLGDEISTTTRPKKDPLGGSRQ